jgi:hypothetical protein
MKYRIVNTWNGGKGGRKIEFVSTEEGEAGHNQCFKWIHRHTPFSFSEATGGQGYVIEPVKRFQLQERCTDVRTAVVEAATPEEAVQIYHSSQASGVELSWDEQEPQETELCWVGEEDDDGLFIVHEWEVENGEITKR